MCFSLGGRLEEARVLLDRFRPVDDGADALVRARALTQLARVLYLMGDLDQSAALFDEVARDPRNGRSWTFLAEKHFCIRCWPVPGVRQAIAGGNRRPAPGARTCPRPRPAGRRAAGALPAGGVRARTHDQLTAAVDGVNLGLVIARERGDPANRRDLLSQEVAPLVALGRWDEAATVAEGLLNEVDISSIAAAAFASQIASGRGSVELMTRCRQMAEGSLESEYVDARVAAAIVLARSALDRGRDPRRARSRRERAARTVHRAGVPRRGLLHLRTSGDRSRRRRRDVRAVGVRRWAASRDRDAASPRRASAPAGRAGSPGRGRGPRPSRPRTTPAPTCAQRVRDRCSPPLSSRRRAVETIRRRSSRRARSAQSSARPDGSSGLPASSR